MWLINFIIFWLSCDIWLLGIFGLLFGVNEKLLTQHISGPVTKYKLL